MVDFSWNDAPGAESHDVQILLPGLDWVDLPADGIDIAFYGAGAVIKNIPLTKYWFARVRAVNSSGVSNWAKYIFFSVGGPEAWTDVPEPVNSVATGAPTIGGSVEVGETLAADVSGISDENGLEKVKFHYQWTRSDGTDTTDIEGATGPSYVLTDEDVGGTIGVRVSFVDRHGFPESLTSEATDIVQAAPTENVPATGAPTIDGLAQEGETLTADTSSIQDEDGLADAVFGYQWLANETDIAGATAASYLLTDDDVGTLVRVRVSFTDDAGNDETLTSEATDTVQAAPTGNVPATGALTIDGVAQVGEMLTTDTSGIAGRRRLGQRYLHLPVASGLCCRQRCHGRHLYAFRRR